MAKILKRYLPGAINMGENPLKADWYILGGGTLIAPQSRFLKILPNPEKTIGISLGVSYNWMGEFQEILKRIKRIYVRDYFSYNVLKKYGIKSILSFDLLCELGGIKSRKRKGIWGNFLHKFPHLRIDNYFALSQNEDMDTMTMANLYTSAIELREDLASVEMIFTTRLHANIIAWLSGCKKVYPIPYDMKVIHFWERIMGVKIKEAQRVIKKHLKEICQEILN